LQRRIAEIQRLVAFFAHRHDRTGDQERDRFGNVENYILLGDFNVVSPEHQTMQALESERFVVPEAIHGDKVRQEGDHFYDQIAVRVKDPRFRVVAGGLVDIYRDLFRDTPGDRAADATLLPATDPEQHEAFRAKTPRELYLKWRTWQLSDHKPLWVQVVTDFADHYLAQLLAPAD
jgi:hypothetical protein